jgi:hypothetical protein
MAAYSGCQKNVPVFKRFFSTTTYAAIPSLGVFKPGAKHPGTPAPIKALPCLCIFPPMAEKSKPPALRVVGDPDHYYEKRYKSCGHSIFKVHVH